jgi:hypothetical protein
MCLDALVLATFPSAAHSSFNVVCAGMQISTSAGGRGLWVFSGYIDEELRHVRKVNRLQATQISTRIKMGPIIRSELTVRKPALEVI